MEVQVDREQHKTIALRFHATPSRRTSAGSRVRCDCEQLRTWGEPDEDAWNAAAVHLLSMVLDPYSLVRQNRRRLLLFRPSCKGGNLRRVELDARAHRRGQRDAPQVLAFGCRRLRLDEAVHQSTEVLQQSLFFE